MNDTLSSKMRRVAGTAQDLEVEHARPITRPHSASHLVTGGGQCKEFLMPGLGTGRFVGF